MSICAAVASTAAATAAIPIVATAGEQLYMRINFDKRHMNLKFKLYNTRSTWKKSYGDWLEVFEKVCYFKTCVECFVTITKHSRRRYTNDYDEMLKYLVSECPEHNERREEIERRKNR